MAHPSETEVRRQSAVEAEPRHDATETFSATAVAVATVSIGYWFLLLRPEARGLDYRLIDTIVQFSGSPERLMERLSSMPVADARRASASALSFAALWSIIGFILLDRWWQRAWKTGPGKETSGRSLAIPLAAGGGIAAALEKIVTVLALRQSGTGVGFVSSPWDIVPKIIVTLAWAKWILAGLLICASVAMAVSAATAFVRRKLPIADQDLMTDEEQQDSGIDPGDDSKTPDSEQPAPSLDSGISCSGGGIRAAAFALGCLSRLEKEPDDTEWTKLVEAADCELPAVKADGRLGILGRARFLSSVSGGGYAAAAWRIAAGTGPTLPDRIIGNPLDKDRERNLANHRERSGSTGALDLLQHVQERRAFLANGPGGLLRSGAMAGARVTLHFSLVLLTVMVLAWPLGRIVVSWAVTGVGTQPLIFERGLPDYEVGAHQWFPPAAFAAVALAAMIVRLSQRRSRGRRIVDVTIKGAAGMSAALFVLTIGLPWAVDRFVGLVPNNGGDQIAVAGVYGAVLAAGWRLVRPRLESNLRYLGGVLLGLGLVIFAVYVVASAADTDELLSGVRVWAGAVAFLAPAFVLFNPDRWSLHSIYRRGLAGTFATIQDAGGVHSLPISEEPPLASYRGAAGPQPIICCAAARDDNRQTGIKVLSMTFEPSTITIHGWKGRGQNVEYDPQSISHAEFQRRLARRVPGDQESVGLHTIIGAAAISGAAVAPSLGRMDMRSTNMLLAAFNARLGAWLPNPTQTGYSRSTTPRLVNMFKEISQMFRENDPNVYTTDGGHWENLGLVELIRRRCDPIICIDASGDPPGTYQTLWDAVELAELECGVTIDIPVETRADLEIADRGRPRKNFGRAVVCDGDGYTADLLYVKAAVSQAAPLHILRYAAADRRFPDYATSDQLLEEDEFSYLVQLGYHSMKRALAEYPTLALRAMEAPSR